MPTDQHSDAQTGAQADAFERFTPATLVGVSDKKMYG